ncbi:carbohydrate binding domain-containing protein [Paenibacillus sp. CC-CFT747]|nr:carbohydrate binding domain-containing protein [Paenibacillus sp. CC-CFT747]
MALRFRTLTGAFLIACMLVQLLIVGVKPADAAAAVNLIGNPGFEATENGIPSEWQAMGDQWNGDIHATTAAAMTGSYGLSIHTDTSNNPWVAIPVPVEAGVTYEISSWYKTTAVIGSVGYKLEYFKGIDKTAANWVTGFSPTTAAGLNDGQWHELKYETVAPPESTYLYVYLRLYGKGTVYFDDVKMVKKKGKPQLAVETDQVYYYPDMREGRVSVEITPEDGILAGKSADIRLVKKSDGTPLFTQIGLPAAANVSADFDPTRMEFEEPYQVIVDLKDNTQQVLESVEKTIYRWNRPGMLPENGPLQVDGKPFFPVVAYHAYAQDYASLKEIGVNTVQGANTNSIATMKTLLDTAQAGGMKMLMTLYYNMKVKENFELTRQMVTTFKNHPALLGYMIMDEPTTNGIPQSELLEAYRLIRSIDPEHPTYMVEADQAAYRSTGQATDLLVTDVYPFYKNSTLPISAVGDSVRGAIAAVDDKKPVWTVLQTFQMPNTNWNVLPTIDQVRNMAYQSFLAGSKGLGFYSVNDPGWKLQESALWPGMVAFKDEISLMGDLLVNGHQVSQSIDGPVQWGIWQKGTDRYAVAVNVSKEPQTATLPLGQGGNRIELLYGSTPARQDSWDNGLTVRLNPEQTFVYQITPFAEMVTDASLELQTDAGILPNGYGPAQINHLLQELNKLSALLKEEPVPVKQTLDRATNGLRELSHLQAWVDGQTDEALNGKKQVLSSSLARVKALVLPIVQSIVRLELESPNSAVTPGDEKRVTVSWQNASEKTISDVQLRIDWPESFGLPPAVKTIGELPSGQGATWEESVIVPETVKPGDYSIQTTMSYTYKGFQLSASSAASLTVTPLLDAKLSPGRLEVNKAGTYPFSVELTNKSNRSIAIEWGLSVPDGITVDLPSTVTLAPLGTKVVQGQVTVPSPLKEGEFSVTIEAKRGEAVLTSLPLTVKVDTNLVYNGGFEKQAAASKQPDGWQMRASAWDQSVSHTGQASVRLTPDSANLFNVVNTDVPKAIPVTPGKKYVGKAWIKNSATAGAVSLGVRQANASGGTLTYTWKDAERNSDWTLYEVSFTALPQAQTAWIYFKLDPAANGAAWIDDIELREVQP